MIKIYLILRIGFYEIVKLDMPPYAVVDENVRLAKDALRPGAGNMVNGILRKLVVLKESEALPLPKVEGDDRTQARALATLYSHPVWMVRRWTKYLGQQETIKLMIWNNCEPSFSLRANRARGFSRDDLVAELDALKVPHKLSLHLDDFIRIKTGLQTIIHAGLLKEGLCSVQDESADTIAGLDEGNFMWGVFRKNKADGDIGRLPDLENIDMDIDMIGGKDMMGRIDHVLKGKPRSLTQEKNVDDDIERLPDLENVDMDIDMIGGKDMMGRIDHVLKDKARSLTPENKVDDDIERLARA